MKIFYFKNKYGYHIETDIEYCCKQMKLFYDLGHRSQFGIVLGHHSGKIRIIGRYHQDIDDYEYVDILYCPFCGNRIIPMLVKK